MTIAIPINSVFTFGGEFGSRGYLLPRLACAIGPVPAARAVGVVWGLWHAPLVLLDGFNFPTNRPLGALPMILLCTAISLILSAVRLASGSIWPSTIAHAALNAQTGIVLVALTPMFIVLGAPLGGVGIAVFAIAGTDMTRTLVPSQPQTR